jgi:mRNA interferase RelE/StbE
MKTVRYTASATRDLRRIPSAKAIVAKVSRLAETGAGDVKPLVNRDGRRRLRIGDYRVIYEDLGEEIVVIAVGHRSTIYE